MLLLMAGGSHHSSGSVQDYHIDNGTCKWCKYQGEDSRVCDNCSRSCVWNYRGYRPDNLIDNFKLS